MSLHVIIISCVTEKQHPTTLSWMIKSQVALKALKYMFWSIVCPLVHQFFFFQPPVSRHLPQVDTYPWSRGCLFMGGSTVQDLICISAGKYMYFE